jgi:hypothetical protein
MSTKTTTKRLALATVVAVGAGLLSIVSVSSANASAGALAITSTNAVNGITPVLDIVGTPKSVGVLNTSGSGLLVNGTVLNTAVISASYTLNTTSAVPAGILITGGTIDTATTSAGSFTVSNGNYLSTTSDALKVAFFVKPLSGSTQITIQGYDGVTSLGSTNTGGSLQGQAILGVTTSATSGSVSVSKSGIFYMGAGLVSGSTAKPLVYTPNGGSVTVIDQNAAGTGTSDFNTSQSAILQLRDAYGNAVSTKTLISVSATNGAYVGLDGTASQNASFAQSGSGDKTIPTLATASIALTTGNSGSDFKVTDSTAANVSKFYGITVTDPTSAPLTTVVTVTAGGVVVGTKSFTFTGKVAKVTLSPAKNGKVSGKGTASIAYYDAAGNKVNADHDTPATPYVNSVTQDANTAGLGITVVSTLTDPTYVDASTPGTKYDTLEYNCPASNATGNIAVDYTNPLDGTVVASNGVAVSCSGAPDTYTAAFDKKSYVAGDIATLTVTFKDSKGAIAADIKPAVGVGAITDGADTSTVTNVPSITGSQLTVVGAPTKSDKTTNGVITYQFIIGTTAGSYQAVVSFPQINNNADGVAQSAAYAVTDGGGTSLNDVLKGIVSLIASINKQIAALAKLVAPAKKK